MVVDWRFPAKPTKKKYPVVLPNGDDKLDSGELEVSSDGTKFEKVADFSGGQARYDSKGRPAMAVRRHSRLSTRGALHPKYVFD